MFSLPSGGLKGAGGLPAGLGGPPTTDGGWTGGETGDGGWTGIGGAEVGGRWVEVVGDRVVVVGDGVVVVGDRVVVAIEDGSGSGASVPEIIIILCYGKHNCFL